jgi:hypothetical protein
MSLCQYPEKTVNVMTLQSEVIHCEMTYCGVLSAKMIATGEEMKKKAAGWLTAEEAMKLADWRRHEAGVAPQSAAAAMPSPSVKIKAAGVYASCHEKISTGNDNQYRRLMKIMAILMICCHVRNAIWKITNMKI